MTPEAPAPTTRQPAEADTPSPKTEKPFVAPAPPVKPPRIVAGVDLDKVLLPKKDAATGITMRVNAGAVLEASIPEAAASKAPASAEALQSLQKDIRHDIEPRPSIPVPPAPVQKMPAEVTIPAAPAAKGGEPPVAAVRTYKGDIEETVREKNVSMVTIAAAQARREAAAPQSGAAGGGAWKRYAMFGVGGVLIVLAVGMLAYLFIPSAPAQKQAGQETPPLIYVDATTRVVVGPNEDRVTFMQELENDREQVHLALGLIERLSVIESASSATGLETDYPASAFLALLAPHAPPALLRSLSDRFLLGVHSFDGNQPFLIFKTSSYEQTYAGMLSWEGDMQGDLSPLFVRKPRPHIPEEGTTMPTAVPQVTGGAFTDRIVENHDARVIQNTSGDILLLWAFVDRETLVIATNEYSLREAITRLKSPPIVPIPN